MPKYIDADALIRLMLERYKTLVDDLGWYDHYTSGYEDAITDVEEAPIVDVVPVVRCKDCKYLKFGDYCYHVGVMEHSHAHKDDYCSYGEKRVGEEEDE